MGRVPNRGQLRQALIPANAMVLSNPVGSAPGFALTWKGTYIAALPGVPSEMRAMMQETVIPLIVDRLKQSKHAQPHPISRVIFQTWGLSEADVDTALQG